MLNCIIVQGRLKAAPELRHTASGTPVASFTLAVTRNRKDQNGEYGTDWMDCVAWGKLGEHAAKWFSKGDQAIVRGRFESRDWEDKNGQKRRSWEIIAESIDFCGSSKKSESTAAASNAEFTEMEDDGDVPF